MAKDRKGSHEKSFAGYRPQGKFDPHFRDRIPEFRYVFFVFGTRRMDSDHDQTFRTVLLVELLYVRHRLDTWLAVEGPEVDDNNFASEGFQCERRAVYPNVGFPDFAGFVCIDNLHLRRGQYAGRK